MTQFLLNPDGTVPAGVDVAALEAAGVKLVWPTARHRPAEGYRLLEGDPVLDGGFWRQVWLEEVAPASVVRVPQVVTMRQARLVLLGAGVLSMVDEMIDATADPATKIYWEYSTEVERNHPLVVTMQAALGLTDTQVDEMFIAARDL